MTIQLKILRNRLILLVILYSILRLLFLAFNAHQYHPFSSGQLCLALLYGLRFDLAALALLNAPLILLSLLLPDKGRWPYFLSHWPFLILNVPFIIANLVDLEYFKYTGKRMTSDIFFLKNEAVEQLGQMVVNYWQVGILAILFTLTLYILSKRWSIPPLPKETGHQESRAFFLGKRLAIGLVLIVVTVIFIRGGFQKKVLKPIHAYTLGQFDLGNLILNSTFTLLKGDLYQGKAKVTYFKTKDKALRHIHNPPLKKKTRSQPKTMSF